jgi:hypothetical protein
VFHKLECLVHTHYNNIFPLKIYQHRSHADNRMLAEYIVPVGLVVQACLALVSLFCLGWVVNQPCNKHLRYFTTQNQSKQKQVIIS